MRAFRGRARPNVRVPRHFDAPRLRLAACRARTTTTDVRPSRTLSVASPANPDDPPPEDDEGLIERWARKEILLGLLAIISLLIGFARFGTAQGAPLWLKAVDGGIAFAFLLDFITRTFRADDRLRYALRHSWEIILFVPYTWLPAQASGGNILRGARLIRVVRVLRFGRYIKLGLGLTRLPRRLRHVQQIARNAQLFTIGLVGILTVAAGAAALFVIEGRTAGLQGYGDALWWSLNLFTTVAYSVPEPETAAGRVVAGTLMVAGVAYIGLFTASLAGAILKTPAEEP